MTSAVSDWEIGGELPEGWVEASLEEIVIHVLGGDWGQEPSEADANPELVRVRVLKGTEFRGWERDRGATAEERAIKRKSLDKRRLAAGDLVIEVSGGGAGQPVGRTLLIDDEALRRAGGPLICNNFCRQLRLHPEIDPAYVHLVLTLRYLCGGFDELQTQTTNIRNLNVSRVLSDVIIPVPPVAEQRRIVEKARELLVKVEASRQRIARVPEILKRFRRSVRTVAYLGRLTEPWREGRPAEESLEKRLGEVLVKRHEAWEMAREEAWAFDRRAPRRPKNLERSEWEVPEPLEAPEVPEGWILASLHDITHRAQYGLSTKADADSRRGVAMLRMGNIRDGRIDAADLKYVLASAAEVSVYRLRRGDILFNRTNSPELVGKAAVFDLTSLEAVFASYLVRIECDEQLVDSRYLCGWINSPWGRSWARTVRTESVSQSNINIARLLRMPVPLPPLAEQREIVGRLESLSASAADVEKSVVAGLDLADKVWRAVLARAFRGELVPTEAELARDEGRVYEPASDLLDRISAERLVEASGPPAVREAVGEVSPAILAAVRQACWGAGAMTREELILRVAVRLGSPKLGNSLRLRLEQHLDTALARRIIAAAGRDGELLSGATPTFGRYDYDFLLRTLRTLCPGEAAYEEAEVTRAVATYLGYGQVTEAIRERMQRVFQWAAQEEALEVRDGWIRRLT